MADDKKILSLVGGSGVKVSKEQAELDHIRALHAPHLEELFAKFKAGTHSYLIVCVDEDNFTSFLSDMGAYQINYEVDKVKMNILFPMDEGDE